MPADHEFQWLRAAEQLDRTLREWLARRDAKRPALPPHRSVYEHRKSPCGSRKLNNPRLQAGGLLRAHRIEFDLKRARFILKPADFSQRISRPLEPLHSESGDFWQEIGVT